MDVILSIKPKYVKSIVDGEKQYEFRKSIFRHRSINHVYIYSSSPVQKIVGRFQIGEILEDHPADLWENVKDNAGIDAREFFSYFEGRSKAYAIEIQNLHEFDEPIDPWISMPGFIPPQSYYYLRGLPMA